MCQIAKELNVDRVWSDRLIPEGVGANLKDELLNKMETRKYANMLIKERIKSKLNPFSNTEVSTNRALQFIPFIDKPHKCSAGKNLFAILPNGDILPCRRLPINIGNIKDISFKEIYLKNRLVQELKKPYIEIDECKKCLFYKSCNGGLRCLSYSYTGSPFNRDPACWRD